MEIQENVLLGAYTTFHIGGPAEFFVIVKTEVELQEAYAFARERALPVTVLGGGSNVLVSDEGVKGLVIKNEITGLQHEEKNGSVFVTAGAGMVWDDLVADTVDRGWWGLENLSAIPGSVGATPVQNVGAYGVEVGECISVVRVYDTESDLFRELQKEECMFGYRDSFFKHAEGAHLVVTRVMFVLSQTPQPKISYKDLAETFGERTPTLSDIREAVIRIRAGKFPDWHTIGTAGSFFKNPVLSEEAFQTLQEKYPNIPSFKGVHGDIKVPLGWILDTVLALKGVQRGNVGTYEKQALVIVNHGNATAKEVDAFAKEVAQKVYDATNIHIEREVRSIT